MQTCLRPTNFRATTYLVGPSGPSWRQLSGCRWDISPKSLPCIIRSLRCLLLSFFPQVVGSQARILYSDQKGRVAIAVAFNQAIAHGKIKVTFPMLLVGASLWLLVSTSTAPRSHHLCMCQLMVNSWGQGERRVCPQTQVLPLVPV